MSRPAATRESELMEQLKNEMNAILDVVNGVIWADTVLYIVLGVGVLFTIWSGFCQFKALTHGIAVTRGVYDDPNDPGAINHFQALSAALSATVGLGNIGGVAVAITLGGPGAVFWMWMIGLAGMALKTTEVALSMLYRNTDDPDEPHGGPMWVAQKGFKAWGLAPLGTIIGGIFCITLLISAVTGGNMFQAWNVAEITHSYFPTVPQEGVGIVLAIIVGVVIIGGIKRIGNVAGKLVPAMCVLYLLAAGFVIISNIGQVPDVIALIFRSAFSPAEADGAFLGGTAGYALLWGMKRALFSSEAGQGSSPIAHSAAKTSEPIRESVVAGLEPFIDTIVVCTLTSIVILSTGIWNRDHEFVLDTTPEIIQAVDADGNPEANTWTIADTTLDESFDLAWRSQFGQNTKLIVVGDDAKEKRQNGNDLIAIGGSVKDVEDQPGRYFIDWGTVSSTIQPHFNFPPERDLVAGAVYSNPAGATLTAKAFDSVTPGLGMWLVTLAAWLFAISTMISWSYYGEQGIIFLFGDKAVLPYKFIYCLLIIVASLPWLITTDKELDNLTALGTGVMLWANIPIMLIFGFIAMKAYHKYMGRLKRGEFPRHTGQSLVELTEGDDPHTD